MNTYYYRILAGRGPVLCTAETSPSGQATAKDVSDHVTYLVSRPSAIVTSPEFTKESSFKMLLKQAQLGN